MTTRSTYALNTLNHFVQQIQRLSKRSLEDLQEALYTPGNATPFLLAVCDEIERRLQEIRDGR